MKVIVVALVLVALAAAGPVPEIAHEPIKIMRSEFDVKPEGGYNYFFDTENGIHREEVGEMKEVLDEEKKPHTVLIVSGKYSYTNSLGEPEVMSYIADENGFHADGPSIPREPKAIIAP